MFYQRCMKGQILSENTFYNRALSIRDAIIAMVQVRTRILMHTEGETETERSRERGAGAWDGEPHTQDTRKTHTDSPMEVTGQGMHLVEEFIVVHLLSPFRYRLHPLRMGV